MKTQIHRLRTRISELRSNPPQDINQLLDTIEKLAEAMETIHGEIGDFDSEVDDYEDGEWGPKFDRVVPLPEETMNEIFRIL